MTNQDVFFPFTFTDLIVCENCGGLPVPFKSHAAGLAHCTSGTCTFGSEGTFGSGASRDRCCVLPSAFAFSQRTTRPCTSSSPARSGPSPLPLHCVGWAPTATTAVTATSVLWSHCPFATLSLIPTTKSAQLSVAPACTWQCSLCFSRHSFALLLWIYQPCGRCYFENCSILILLLFP